MIRLRMTTQGMTARSTAPANGPTVRPGGAATDNGQRTTDKMRGFTLVELLIVVVVLAILMSLLLPVINGALRTARYAAVSAEINSLAQALANFKAKYGDYPPSRIYLKEDGNYVAVGSNVSVNGVDPRSPGGANDITIGQLASRTLTAFRKFWPRVQLNTQRAVFAANSPIWYDFNGNGQLDHNPYVLEGHECLVFFLGGIPLHDVATGTYAMTGFGKDPTNPFSNSVIGSSMYNANRQEPFFEFNAGRLFADPANSFIKGQSPSTPIGIPAYYDTLNTGPPLASPAAPFYGGTGPVNFYAYFSAYGNGNYDPNDVNIHEIDQKNLTIELQYTVNFPIPNALTTPPLVYSLSPNPYTTTLTAGTSSGTITYQSPQTFQIISAGIDGLYGVGGQYLAPSQSAIQPLPIDTANTNSTDRSIRQREYDNITNFKSGRLNN